jgi:hypothetical protein
MNTPLAAGPLIYLQVHAPARPRGARRNAYA